MTGHQTTTRPEPSGEDTAGAAACESVPAVSSPQIPQPGRETPDPGRAAVPASGIDARRLSVEQHAGMACVVCTHEFSGTEHPIAVGYVGSDHHYVYACPRPCAGTLDRLVTDHRPQHAIRWPT